MTEPNPDDHPLSPSVLTVWKKSSMSFQGTDGFTVFDHRGRLVFRVDNYTRKSWSAASGGGGLLLMDGTGKALLKLKPQVCTYRGNLLCYQSNLFFFEGEKKKIKVTYTTTTTNLVVIVCSESTPA